MFARCFDTKLEGGYGIIAKYALPMRTQQAWLYFKVRALLP
jgi:hypothetical protein